MKLIYTIRLEMREILDRCKEELPEDVVAPLLARLQVLQDRASLLEYAQQESAPDPAIEPAVPEIVPA
jgi:hypothetical protein